MRALILCIVSTLALTSCSSPAASGPPSKEAVSVIEVTGPSSDSLEVGTTLQLSASAFGKSGASLGSVPVSWKSSAPAIMEVRPDGSAIALLPGQVLISASTDGVTGGRQFRVYAPRPPERDLSARGVPALVTADYIESSRVGRVSYFRSGFGHDYADETESCRSMKHYFIPTNFSEAASIGIFAPFSGTVSRVMQEQTFGTQVQIRSRDYPAFTVIIFHVEPDAPLAVGQPVSAGDRIGHHIGPQTASDVAIRVATPVGDRFISYFEALSDEVWNSRYRLRGLTGRDALVHRRDTRNANPLTCDSAGNFLTPDPLPLFVTLD